MAVGSAELGELAPVAGLGIGITSAGIKTPGRDDTVVFEICEGASVAGVFTKNAFCAAPVQLAKSHLLESTPRYLVINTGNANAGTGPQGYADARATCAELARLAGVAETAVLPFSTGVIGEPLPLQKLLSALPVALSNVEPDTWLQAASGIMTTDTRPKASSRQFSFQGEIITLTGISKGAGMIKPNMATMLAFVATDAAVSQDVLQGLLDEAVEQSFNRITIDGDTSTNDACMLIATGCAKVAAVGSTDGELYELLRTHINAIFLELAQAIVRDGEGATKFVAVDVCGANNTKEALQVAYCVAESPLVKTALFASDPNWGRILAAIGRAGVSDLCVDDISVFLGDVLIVEQGGRAAGYREQDGAAVMAEDELQIRIELNRGQCNETVWTTDLSYDYVKINAEYRT